MSADNYDERDEATYQDGVEDGYERGYLKALAWVRDLLDSVPGYRHSEPVRRFIRDGRGAVDEQRAPYYREIERRLHGEDRALWGRGI